MSLVMWRAGIGGPRMVCGLVESVGLDPSF